MEEKHQTETGKVDGGQLVIGWVPTLMPMMERVSVGRSNPRTSSDTAVGED